MSNVEFPSAWSTLQHPYKRRELINILADIETSRARNGNIIRGEAVNDIDALVHFLFDDSDLGSNPESEIGLVLLNAAEAQAIRELSKHVDELVEDIGDKNIASYIADPRWSDIESKSEVALNLLNLK